MANTVTREERKARKEIGNLIAQARAKKGLSTRELAGLVGINRPATISDYKQGTHGLDRAQLHDLERALSMAPGGTDLAYPG